MKKIHSLFICTLLLGAKLLAQCDFGEDEIHIFIEADVWVAEDPTIWQLTDVSGNIIGQGQVPLNNLDVTYCEPAGCFTFTITDGYGDGLINGGYYLVSYNGTTVGTAGNFGYEDVVHFGGCPPGSSCDFPLIITEGDYIAPAADSWYEFTVPATGQYEVSTCGNGCNTTIWGYTYCAGLTWDNTNIATSFFAESGCPASDQALSSFNATAGNVYYIRIGSASNACNGAISWSLIYMGPAVGCMDPSACNYDPLATVGATCIYPGNPDCPNGPDLIILQSAIENSLNLTTVNGTDCNVNELCVLGFGTRQILRFTTHIQNIGNQDYYIGTPPSSSSTPSTQFEWDECHQHWHYEGYAEYVLYDVNGVETPVGFKNGFCVVDLECDNGGQAKYTCDNMGITSGCGDIYDSYLSCQWIDLTTVAAGFYTFVVRVNWDQSPDALGRYEIDYSNNWAQVCIEIVRDASGSTITAVNMVNDCASYVDCAGQIFGAAQPDCEGVCNGTHLSGDIDNNITINAADAELLAYSSLSSTTAGTCNDVNSDGTINVLDAAQVYSCVNGSGPCEFPLTQVVNFNNMVSFSLLHIDPLAQFVDIAVRNPTDSLLAWQLWLSGLQIIGVENLISEVGYNPEIIFTTDGQLLSSCPNGVAQGRYASPTGVVRVYYSLLLTQEICIGGVVAAMDNYRYSLGIEGSGCLSVPERLSITVLLEGSFMGGNMRTDLQDNNLLPPFQPFGTPPWLYNGGEQIADWAAIPAVTDWVLVQLRDANDPSIVVAQRAGLLGENGQILERDGNSGLYFLGLPAAQYYLAVYGRGHLGVISASALPLPDTNFYDFSENLSQTMGNGAMSLGSNGKYLLFCGDFDGNGVINNLDYNMWSANSAATNQYLPYDGDMNGVVNAMDYNRWYANRSKVGHVYIQF